MLTPSQIERCRKTMSANAFLLIVMDALERKESLSIVREADGEKKLLQHCRKHSQSNDPIQPFSGMDAAWLERYGCTGIPLDTLAYRIYDAAVRCTYFAPSISGITMPSYDVYDLFPPRPLYVDNFFPNLWNEDQKASLFKAAGHVLFIHSNRKLADAMKARAEKYHGVKVSYLPLSNWDQTEDVWTRANIEVRAPLTIFSAGPASKFIGPRISGVTLDIGAAADRWSFLPRFELEKKRAAELGRLDEFTRAPYAFA